MYPVKDTFRHYLSLSHITSSPKSNPAARERAFPNLLNPHPTNTKLQHHLRINNPFENMVEKINRKYM